MVYRSIQEAPHFCIENTTFQGLGEFLGKGLHPNLRGVSMLAHRWLNSSPKQEVGYSVESPKARATKKPPII